MEVKDEKEINIKVNVNTSSLSVGKHSETVWFYTNKSPEVLVLEIEITPAQLNLNHDGEEISKFYGETVSINESNFKDYGLTIKDHGNQIDNQDIIKQLGLNFSSDGFASNADVNEDGYEINVTESSDNYDLTIPSDLKIKVNKAIPLVNAGVTSITENQAISQSELTGSATNPYDLSMPVQGTLTWSNGTVKPKTGDNEIEGQWNFTVGQADQKNYQNTQGIIKIPVTPLIPTLIEHTGETSVVYDGNSHSLNYRTNREDDNIGKVKVEFKLKKSEEDENSDEGFSEEEPVNAGIYIVRATIEASDKYGGAVHKDHLEIKQKSLNFSISSVKEITYNDTTELSNNTVEIAVEGAISSDSIEPVYSVMLDHKDAGEQGLTVKITDITGNNKGNYKISETGQDLIIHKQVNVKQAKIKLSLNNNEVKKYYGEPINLGSFEYTPTDLRGNDTMEDLPLSFTTENPTTDYIVGNYKIIANLNSGNYIFESGTSSEVGTLKIEQATVELSQGSPLSGNGYKGKKLIEIPITGTCVNSSNPSLVVPGRFQWVNENDSIPESTNGTYQAQWKFILKDNINYKTADNKELTGTVDIKVLTKKPITIEKLDPITVSYNTQNQGIDPTSIQITADTDAEGNNPIDPLNVPIKVEYKLVGDPQTAYQENFKDWNTLQPIDAGIYEVKITASAEKYNTRADSEVQTIFTIEKINPVWSSGKPTVINSSDNSVPQGTPLSQIQLTLPNIPKSVQGEFLWTQQTGVVEQEGTYEWIFNPTGEDLNNFKPITDTIYLKLAPDNRTIQAAIYNLPKSAGNDYAVINEENGNKLEVNDVVQLFNGNDPISDEVKVTEPKSFPITLTIDEDALSSNGGEVLLKIVNSKMHNGTKCKYDPILDFTIDLTGVISNLDNNKFIIESGKEAELTLKKSLDSYLHQQVEITTPFENVVSFTSVADTKSLTRKFKGQDAGATQINCKVIFEHPDKTKSESTIEISKEITAICTKLESDLIDKPSTVQVDNNIESTLKNELEKQLSTEDFDSLSKGDSIKVTLDIDEKTKNDVLSDANKIENNSKTKDYIVSKYLDISLEKVIVDGETGKVTKTNFTPTSFLSFTVEIPKEDQKSNVDYRIIHVHNNNPEIIVPIQNGWKLTFSTKTFSTFAIAYKEKSTQPDPGTGTQPDKPSIPSTPGTGGNPGSSTPSQKSISNAKVTVEGGTAYTGHEVKPKIKVVLDGKALSEGRDYEVTYSNNVQVGTASVTVKGIGSYTGTVSATFKITSPKLTLSPTSLELSERGPKGSVRVSGYVGNVTVASSNSSVAKAEFHNGVLTVTPLSSGSADITVKCNGSTKVLKVKVSKAQQDNTPQPGPNNPPAPQNVAEVWRLYNPVNGEHLFTLDRNEYDTLATMGWTQEGKAWTAPASSDTPVYRLYNTVSGDHHYTKDVNERNTLMSGDWRDEGVAWYSTGSNGVKVYRLYNHELALGGFSSHHYTTDANEYATLPSVGWTQEGECWYGVN